LPEDDRVANKEEREEEIVMPGKGTRLPVLIGCVGRDAPPPTRYVGFDEFSMMLCCNFPNNMS
jgi:hypothetical protein